MSIPSSLRLCCIAAMPMAPALTEAASQSKGILPSSPPSASADLPPPVVNGRDRTGHNDLDSLQSDKVLPSTKLVSLTSHINFHTSQGGVLKQVCLGSKFRTLDSASLSQLGVIKNLPNVYNNARRSFPSKPRENAESLKPVVSQNKMNKPKTANMPPATVGKIITGVPSAALKLKVNNSVQGFVIQAVPSVERTKLPTVQRPRFGDAVCDVSAQVKEEPKVEVNSSDIESIGSNLPNNEMVEQANKMHHHLERRTQHLIRRLRRLQGRQLEYHTEQQLSSFVEYQNQNLQTVAKSMKPMTQTQERKPDLLQSHDVKNLSTAALVNLVRKLQSTQSSISLGQHILNSAKSASLGDSGHSVLVLDEATRLESQRTAEHIGTNLRVLESALDSDATESSSGGESCEECDVESEKERKQKTPLHRRAEWKWATDRAAVAARWTWLQAQVSDLEYRIRQQSEIYRRIRESKGCVKLGDPLSPGDITVKLRQVRPGRKPSPLETKIAKLEQKNEMSPCNISTLLMNVNKQATKLTQSLGNCFSPVQNSMSTDQLKSQSTPNSLNGVINSSHISTQSDTDTESVDSVNIGPSGDSSSVADAHQPVDVTCQAARCLPVRTYRKRKLLSTAGLHLTSRKAARLSAVKCGCYPPRVPCPICGGRYNNSQTVDPNTMPLYERVSLLDPAFHPVLSFPQEIPLKIHFEALLRTGEWQHKPPAKATKLASTQKRRQKLLVTEKDLARKTSRKLAKQAVLFSSAKIRNKYDGKNGRKKQGGSLPGTPRKRSNNRKCHTQLKRRRAAQLALARLQNPNRILSVALSGPMGICDSRTPTPSPQSRENGSLSSSCTSLALKEMREALRKRRGESDYDINNIVIPYSMAASTRVEKLKYKEIVTPKWRDVTLDPDKLDEESPDEDQERQPGETVELDVDKSDNSCIPEACEEEDEEVENLSDEIFIERHLKCEVQEKKRFLSHIHTNKKNRPKRPDGTIPTQEPTSPDIPFPNETPSPTIIPLTPTLVLPPSPMPVVTTSTAQSTVTAEPVGGRMNPPKDDINRRRSSSVSSGRKSISLEENSRESFYDFDFRSPKYESWTPRCFPLTEDEYEDMLTVQPPASILIPVCNTPETPHVPRSEILTPSSSHPCSPMPSTSSGSIIGEDPNDPEWTVIGDKVTPKQQLSVVLKLAKR